MHTSEDVRSASNWCENPSIVGFLTDLAFSYQVIAEIDSAAGRPEEAIGAFTQAKNVRVKRANANPSVAEFQSDLAADHNRIGVLYCAAGRQAQARESCQCAWEIQERLVREHPDLHEFASRLVRRSTILP